MVFAVLAAMAAMFSMTEMVSHSSLRYVVRRIVRYISYDIKSSQNLALVSNGQLLSQCKSLGDGH